MKKSVAMKWIKALRSGRYTQGKDALKTRDNSYCCLGVLCDISKKGYWDDKAYRVPSVKERVWTTLHIDVMKYSGVKTPFGEIKFRKGSVTLTELNDIRNRSFKQIAAYIERNWEKL